MTVRTAGLLIAAGLCALTLAVGGCGSRSDTDDGGEHAGAGASSTAPANYDTGPRASSVAPDADRAHEGKELFSEKGCTACHGFGQRMAGPDLQGVTTRRTEEWLRHWISEPDVMQKTDPIARQLLAEYPTQMPNLHLTPDEVAQLIDYMRLQDKTLGAAH